MSPLDFLVHRSASVLHCYSIAGSGLGGSSAGMMGTGLDAGLGGADMYGGGQYYGNGSSMGRMGGGDMYGGSSREAELVAVDQLRKQFGGGSMGGAAGPARGRGGRGGYSPY